MDFRRAWLLQHERTATPASPGSSSLPTFGGFPPASVAGVVFRAPSTSFASGQVQITATAIEPLGGSVQSRSNSSGEASAEASSRSRGSGHSDSPQPDCRRDLPDAPRPRHPDVGHADSTASRSHPILPASRARVGGGDREVIRAGGRRGGSTCSSSTRGGGSAEYLAAFKTSACARPRGFSSLRSRRGNETDWTMPICSGPARCDALRGGGARSLQIGRAPASAAAQMRDPPGDGHFPLGHRGISPGSCADAPRFRYRLRDTRDNRHQSLTALIRLWNGCPRVRGPLSCARYATARFLARRSRRGAATRSGPAFHRRAGLQRAGERQRERSPAATSWSVSRSPSSRGDTPSLIARVELSLTSSGEVVRETACGAFADGAIGAIVRETGTPARRVRRPPEAAAGVIGFLFPEDE